MSTALKVENDNNRDQSNTRILDSLKKVYAYIEFDADGNIQYANDIFLSALEYTADELEGMGLPKITGDFSKERL